MSAETGLPSSTRFEGTIRANMSDEVSRFAMRVSIRVRALALEPGEEGPVLTALQVDGKWGALQVDANLRALQLDADLEAQSSLVS